MRISWTLLLPLTLGLLTACSEKDDDDDDAVDADGDGSPEGEDCDDGDAAAYPGADELCDGVDNDCDDEVDEDATDAFSAWADADGDGFGDAGAEVALCEDASGYVDNDEDCDDADATAFPGNAEVCDGVDNDCNAEVDDAPSDGTTYYLDADGDGYGDAGDALDACSEPSDRVEDATDCDDADAAVNPGATEACNGIDDDCDSEVDEAGATGETLWYVDVDVDGYGDLGDPGALACDAPTGTVADNTDCDDTAGGVNPGAAELCDGVDTDCDASTSEDGMVSFTDSAGTTGDATADFSGSSGSPATVTLADAGTYLFCDGTYYADIDVEADVSITSLSSGAVFDGSGSHSIFNVETDAITLTLDDVVLQNGAGDGGGLSAFGVAGSGGGVHCDASSSVALRDVRITDSSADMGGGIAASGCVLDIVDSQIDENDADAGGALALSSSSATLTGSLLNDNAASLSGGGVFVHDSDVVLDESLVDSNVAQWGGGAYLYGGDLTCTGSAAADAGFTANEASEWGAGITLRGSGSNSFTGTDCDFGTSAGGDDNDADDLFQETVLLPFIVDDDATFTCDDDGCGTQATSQSGTGADAEYAVLTHVFRGNQYDVTGTPTLESFGFYLGLDETCDVSFYVHFYDGTEWIVLWSDEVSHAAGTDFVTAGDVGLALEDGDEIILGFGKDCDGGYFGTSASAGASAGFGDWTGDVWYENDPTLSSSFVPSASLPNSYLYDVEVTYWDE